MDYSELAAMLRNVCLDYDGSDMANMEPTRVDLTCGEVREAAEAITALEARVAELEARMSDMMPIAGGSPFKSARPGSTFISYDRRKP